MPPLVQVDAKDLKRALREIGDAGLTRELATANKNAATVVTRRALPNVPVRTGRLRRSVRALGSIGAGQVKAGSAAVDYAAAIHWGRVRGGFIRARPFLWNAAQSTRREVERAYVNAVDRLLKKLR